MMNYKTVFENEHLVIVDKPALVLSVPSRMGEKETRPCLGTILQDKLKIQIFPVHRLDFEVSGLVIFAKTAVAHREANLWFENKLVQKTYEAFSEGNGQNLEIEKLIEWRANILRGKKRAYESPYGKPSLTKAMYLGGGSGQLKWNLEPVTGRSHQLRFDLFRHGFPILGDELYGAKSRWNQSGIALKSVKINFSATKNFEQFGLPSIITTTSLF